jgi:hypothetical protein
MITRIINRYRINRKVKSLPGGFLLAAIVFASCQKIVNIDLNTASPNIVIEAVINNGPGPYMVKLSKTGSYFNTPVLPPVSGAVVIISDNIGRVDTLREDSAGMYFTHIIQGIPGMNYALSVQADNVVYTANSTMMSAVNIDSLGIDVTQRFSLGPRIRRDSSLTIHFKDPASEKNYYRIKFIEKRIINLSSYHLYDDVYTNGEEVDLRAGKATRGDTDIVELISLDQYAYDYYRTLGDILRINPIFGSTPANPNTNLSHGALGYFAAVAITKKEVIIH